MTTFQATSDQASSSDLPRPVPAVTDSGRIKFGASCRLPLPAPAVTDSGRIKFGASCRLPLQK